MTARRALVFVALVLALGTLLGAFGCARCSNPPLATLTSVEGAVERDFSTALSQWQPALLGAEFQFGDAVRTREVARGTVTFDDGALMRLEPSTTVRFQKGRPGSNERGLDVLAGEAVLEPGANPMRVRTELGVAVLDSGSVTRIGKTERGLRIFVSVGLARLEGEGTSHELGAGEGVEVGIGMAILESFQESAPAAGPATTATELPEAAPKEVIARISGSKARVQRPGVKGFEPLPAGEHTLAPGSRLELGANDRAELTRGKAAAELSGPGAFLVVDDPRRIVEPVQGAVTLRAEGKDVTMEIPGGTVTALGSEELSIGEVRLDAKGRSQVRVRAGKLRVELPSGTTTLRAGETGEVRGGQLEVGGRGLQYHDILLSAGGSIIVHDPAPPTAVGIVFADVCTGTGVVERRGKRGTGSAAANTQANLSFEAGQHSYEVRCLSPDGKLGPTAARGTVTVLADSGTMALPTKAPGNSVNTDGRDYTLLYQNLLPSVSVQWPNAPSAEAYTLTWKSPSGSQSFTAASASYSFASGRLGEGTHSFQWKTSSGRQSRTSRATIRFDNAAPKASIRSPANGSFGPGATVAVAGIALPGWEVMAQGQRLEMDSEHRFAGSVASGPRGLVLQFTHPQRGVHHYLRRASGVSP